MNSLPLPDFIGFLNEQKATDFKSDKVDRFLGNNRINSDDFLPYIFFREETYGRNLVVKTDLYELLVLTWMPQQRTPIHDHGGQRCWMMVQSGSLSFKNYCFPETECCDLKVLGSVEACCQGGCVYIDDGIGVHAITNCTRKPAISVHLYAAPVPTCRIYNEKSKRFENVQLEYFTQIPYSANKNHNIELDCK